MSIPAKDQASRFLAPLKGTLTLMLLHDIHARLPTSRFLLSSARSMALRTSVLDTDAYYCANIDSFAAEAQSITGGLFLLSGDEVEASSLIPLLSSTTEMLVVDDLNSLYSLASDGRKLHQLAIMMRLLSHNAKLNGSWVIATAYKTEGAKRDDANRRSLTSFADKVIEVETRQGSLRLKTGIKGMWPDDELNV